MFQSSFRPARLPARAILVSLIALAGLTGSAVAQTYVLGSPNSTLNADLWSLDSPNMSAFRAAITNPAYFGSGGTVATFVSITDLSTITSGTLAGLNGFMSPWWNIDQSAGVRETVLSAFDSGMDLWLLEDGTQHSSFGPALCISAIAATGSVSNGGAPFFSGPFGSAFNTATFGEFAAFDAADIVRKGGLVGGTNVEGEITITYWPRGIYSATSGALILFSDVDMISNWMQNPYVPTLNANGVLALNTMGWLTAGATAIPELGTYALVLGWTGLGLVLVRRRLRPAS